MPPLIASSLHAQVGHAGRTVRRPPEVGVPRIDPVVLHVFAVPVVRELPALHADASDDVTW